jgi:DnaJ family protein C protein 2
LQRSFKQAEKTSLAEFVQAAQRADPRMKRWREEQQRKKDAKKEYQQSEADKRSLLEQQAREGEELKAREVAEKEAAEKDAQKKNREKEKRRRKEAQKTFRAVCAKLYSDEEKTLTPEHVEIVAGASQVSVEELRTLTAALRDKGKEAIEGGFAAVLRDVMFKRSGPIAVAAAASASPARGNDNNNNNEAVVTEATPWTLDELSHLARATNKYPGGFTERWEHIMADLKHFGIHRTLADVQARAVELKKGKQASLVVDEDQVNRDIIRKVESNKLEAAPSQNYNAVAGDPNVWTNAQMKQLQEGLQAVPKDADKRFETIAAKYVPGKSAEQCAEKFKALVAVAKQKSAAAAAGSGPKTAIAQATAEEWTLEQQKQLEHGLKTVPADDPWRWDKIAAGVTGKDRKQVVSRYNELVQRLKKK